MRPSRLLFFFVLSLLVALPRAHAAGGRIVVLVPQIKPQATDEVRNKLHDALARGLSRAGEVVPAAQVRASGELARCSAASCVVTAAIALGAEKVIVTEIDGVGKSYTIRLKVFDPTGQELPIGSEERCEICSIGQASRAVRRAGEHAALVVAAQGTPPLGTASKVPMGDDDEAPGIPSPAARASLRGDADTRPAATATLVPPDNLPPTAAMPATSGAAQSKRFPYKPVAIGAFSVAGASLIAAITFGVYAAKEDQTTCDPSLPRSACPTIYQGNIAPTAVFGALTGVAAGAGALLLYLDWKRPKNRPLVTAGPIPSGFAASARYDF